MALVFWGLVAASAGVSLLYWVAYCYRPASLRKTFVKTLSIVMLAVASLVAGGPVWLTCALALCALGDYLLALDREKAFLAGVGAFALGHVFYILTFVTQGFSDVRQLGEMPFVAGVGGFLILAAFMARVLFAKAGAFKFAVMAYVPIIVGMGIGALTLPMIWPLGLAIIGALLFVASDFVLAMEMFVLRERHWLRKGTPFVIWGTYWSAQVMLLIALSGAMG